MTVNNPSSVRQLWRSWRFRLMIVPVWLALGSTTTIMTTTAQGESFSNKGPSTGPLFQGTTADSTYPQQLSFVRCPTQRTPVFVRNETGGFDQLVLLPDGDLDTANAFSRGHPDGVNSDGSVQGNDDKVELFHACWCTEYYNRPMEYCPSHLDMCIVHGPDGPVRCISYSGKDSFAQFVWPTGFFFVSFVFVMFLVTSRGKYAFQFAWRKLRVGCQMKQRRRGDVDVEQGRITDDDVLSQMARQMLAREGGRPALLGEDFVRRESRRVQAWNAEAAEIEKKKNKAKEKKPFVLRTKSFASSSSSSSTTMEVNSAPISSNGSVENNDHHVDHDVDEIECVICFETLQQGDKVGDIPCGHVFHKDCLKAWVVKTWKKQRTRCPLCQDRDLIFLHVPADDKNSNRGGGGNAKETATEGMSTASMAGLGSASTAMARSTNDSDTTTSDQDSNGAPADQEQLSNPEP